MDAPGPPWLPSAGAYAEQRGLWRLLQVNGAGLLGEGHRARVRRPGAGCPGGLLPHSGCKRHRGED